MVKFKESSRPLSVFQVLFNTNCIFKYFSRQIVFSRTVQDSPVYSRTFQACANPGIASNEYLQHDFSGEKKKNSIFDTTLNYGKSFTNISLILFPPIVSFVVCPFIYLCSLEVYTANTKS